jgi:hypothetical protein
MPRGTLPSSRRLQGWGVGRNFVDGLLISNYREALNKKYTSCAMKLKTKYETQVIYCAKVNGRAPGFAVSGMEGNNGGDLPSNPTSTKKSIPRRSLPLIHGIMRTCIK